MLATDQAFPGQIDATISPTGHSAYAIIAKYDAIWLQFEELNYVNLLIWPTDATAAVAAAAAASAAQRSIEENKNCIKN